MNVRTHSLRAFTLLELLVATAIALALAGLMLSIATGVMAQWRRDRALGDQAIVASQALDAIERDLQAAVRSETDGCFAADIVSDTSGLANHGWLVSARMKPSGTSSVRLPADVSQWMTDARFGLSGSWLRFVTTNVESGGSLPTTVAYQLVRRPVSGNPVAANPAPVRYGLYRSVVSASETFSAGYDVTSSAYASASNTPSSALSTAFRQARNVTNPSHANLMAPNVVDFGCGLYVRASTGEPRLIHPQPSSGLSYRFRSGRPDAAFPEIVDVWVRVLSEEGAAAVASIEGGRRQRPPSFGSDAEWWWATVEMHSRVFVRRVEIRSAQR